MKESDSPRRLWQQIGIEQSPLCDSIYSKNKNSSQDIQEKYSDVSEVLSAINTFPKKHNMPQLNKDKIYFQTQQKELHHSDTLFKHLTREINEKDNLIQQLQQIKAVEEQFYVANVLKKESNSPLLDQSKKDQIHLNLMESPIFSEDPLLCSKKQKLNKKQPYNGHRVKLNLLRSNISQVKQQMQELKSNLRQFVKIFSRDQEKLLEEVNGKYQQLDQQYSMKLQQLVFSKKQQYEQLKYDYDVIKVKEQATRYPVRSQYFIPETNTSQLSIERNYDSRGFQQTNQRQLIIQLELEKQHLAKEINLFKQKIVGIQANAQSIKDSNDKLYQYIFDLEQKCAFHKQEIIIITQKVKYQIQQNFKKRLQQLDQDLQNQRIRKNKLQQQLDQIQQQLNKVTIQKKIIQEKLIPYQQEFKGLKLQILQLKSCLKIKYQELEKAEKNRKQLIENISLLKNRESQLEYISRKNDQFQNREVSRQTLIKRQSQLNDWRKIIEQLKIQKTVLQRQNIQLRASFQLYNKNSQNQWGFQHSRQNNSYSIQNHYLPQIFKNEVSSTAENYLKMKQRQLEQYQQYLFSQNRRLQQKQSQIEANYITTKIRERSQRRKVYDSTTSEDNYGMKTKTLLESKTKNTKQRYQSRNNQFFSNEAHAIIQKVRRKQNGNNSCHSNCENSCRCQVLSRGSRTSQDSEQRNLQDFQTYKPSISPCKDYYVRGQKNSKMKLIEDKVKRLKSQLKNSLATMIN